MMAAGMGKAEQMKRFRLVIASAILFASIALGGVTVSAAGDNDTSPLAITFRSAAELPASALENLRAGPHRDKIACSGRKRIGGGAAMGRPVAAAWERSYELLRV